MNRHNSMHEVGNPGSRGQTGLSNSYEVGYEYMNKRRHNNAIMAPKYQLSNNTNIGNAFKSSSQLQNVYSSITPNANSRGGLPAHQPSKSALDHHLGQNPREGFSYDFEPTHIKAGQLPGNRGNSRQVSIGLPTSASMPDMNGMSRASNQWMSQ